MRSELPPGWEARPLAACGIWTSGGTPAKSRPEYWDGDIPWVGPKDMHTRYVERAEESITAEGAANGTRLVPADTVLVVVRSMALARRLQIALTRREIAFNQDIKAITPAADVLPRYLLYALWGSHDAIHALVDEASHGTKRLRTEILGEFQVSLPPIDEQRHIAAVLGAFDDKIESNERRGELQAQVIDAMFDHHLIAHADSNNWTNGDLTSIARFVNGRAFTKDATGTGRPVLRIKELNSGITDATVVNDVDADDDNIARHHDLLFSWSGSLETYRWHGPESLINQHIFKVLPHDGFPTWFVEGWVRRHLPEFQRIARDKATTMGHIKREHLNAAKLKIPPADFITDLHRVLGPLDDQLGALAAETITLRAIRDELLPKLVSGEIRVLADGDEGDSEAVAA
jgi:type I restriction enzyme, S subunit